MKANSVIELIGNTAHLHLANLFPHHNVWIKLEQTNPGGSIKDRVALAMINDAEAKGLLVPQGVIIEPTSGNTGIGLALIGAVRGYKVIIVMPNSMSVERQQILKAYGATVVLTPSESGMEGAIAKAKEIQRSTPNSFVPLQFENMANPKVHENTTAVEIIADFPNGIDFLITGVGTGGHISGLGKALKQKFCNLKVVAVEPQESAVLSRASAAPHPLQGIGAGFIPDTLCREVIDEVLTVNGPDAYQMVRNLATKEGVMAGISTGASLAAISRKIADLPPDATVLTLAYDTGDRYLSVEGLWKKEQH